MTNPIAIRFIEPGSLIIRDQEGEIIVISPGETYKVTKNEIYCCLTMPVGGGSGGPGITNHKKSEDE